LRCHRQCCHLFAFRPWPFLQRLHLKSISKVQLKILTYVCITFISCQQKCFFLLLRND
jgi:hypothetical protein